MSVFDDLAAEQDRLEGILIRFTDEEWLSESGAAGWTVADVVLHLAQSEEGVIASAAGVDMRSGLSPAGGTVDDLAATMVEAERAAPAEVFARWQRARRTAVAALRDTDPQRLLQWVANPVKPATLATTRLAEHWAHGLDITGPLGIEFPDTARLRNIAWLAHRTLPYALVRAGEPAVAGEVRCELIAPDGTDIWAFGPAGTESVIAGPAGIFCRVAAQRLDPARSGLKTTGPHADTALRVLRTYA
jgi:uncharacterized protein (TIGR03084 family)